MPRVDDPVAPDPIPPATLSAAAVVSSAAVGSWHARQVTFLVSATNAEVLSAAVVEASNNDGNTWWNASGQPTLEALGIRVTGAAEGLPLNSGDLPVVVTPSVGEHLAVKLLRLTLTAASVDISGLRVQVAVVRE